MSNNKELSFEAAMDRLESLVTLLENGKTGLDEALAAFEEGIGLLKHCNEKLNEAEGKVVRLIDKGDGVAEETPLAPMG